MGRFALLTIAIAVCCRLASADPVAEDVFLRELPLRSDTLVTLKLDAGPSVIMPPVISDPGQYEPSVAMKEFASDETSLVTSAVGGIESLFDENGEIALEAGEDDLAPAVVSSNGSGVNKFDWPDFSGIVELLVQESARNLVSKYQLPGDPKPKGKKKKKKKTKEEHLANARCRSDRTSRSLFSRGFHILAAAFIGTFLIIVVLRKSGKGTYWW
jgi:hypothetical protein